MAIDWTGKILVALTWSLLCFGNYVTITQIFNTYFLQDASFLSPTRRYTAIGALLFSLYELLLVLALLSHVLAVFGNPGVISKHISESLPKNLVTPRTCHHCGFKWKPPRAHHCRKCQVCVFRMDHHCAWIDNCVGILNQKFFILFLAYSAALCVYQLLLLFLGALLWVYKAKFKVQFLSSCLVISLTLIAAAFFYMTVDTFYEQYDALKTNSTLIESHQHIHGREKPLLSNIADVFGKNKLTWLLPIHPYLELDYAEPVFLDKDIALRLQQQEKQRKSSARTNIAGRSRITSNEVRNRHHHSKKSIEVVKSEDPLLPPEGFDFTKSSWPTHTYSKNESGSLKDNESDDSKYEENQFINMYMKPWIDIGIELDDGSKFIQLEDIDGDDNK